MKGKLLLLFLLTTLTHFGQSNITGTVLNSDDLTTLHGIKIINLNSKQFCYSNEYGGFSVKGVANDTLSFESTFFNPLQVVVTQYLIDKKDNKFEMKETVFDLAEVNLIKFNKEVFNLKLNEEIQNDIKNRPYLYYPKPELSFNIAGVIGFVIKPLMKKEIVDNRVTLSYEFFESLFENNPLFNDVFLTQRLGLNWEEKSLFFEFCSFQNLKVSKETSTDNFQLMDMLIKQSEIFKKRKTEN